MYCYQKAKKANQQWETRICNSQTTPIDSSYNCILRLQLATHTFKRPTVYRILTVTPNVISVYFETRFHAQATLWFNGNPPSTRGMETASKEPRVKNKWNVVDSVESVLARDGVVSNTALFREVIQLGER